MVNNFGFSLYADYSVLIGNKGVVHSERGLSTLSYSFPPLRPIDITISTENPVVEGVRG